MSLVGIQLCENDDKKTISKDVMSLWGELEMSIERMVSEFHEYFRSR